MSSFRRLTAPTETRPWGGFQNLFEAQGFKIKLLEVAPGARLSLQRHRLREEHWIVVEGVGDFELDGESGVLMPGDMVTVRIGQTHRIANPGLEPLVILELQRGECDESDIVRLEDVYGRST